MNAGGEFRVEVLDGEPGVETVVDPEILGGLKVQIGNYFIDLSLATKIDKINTLLANTSQQ